MHHRTDRIAHTTAFVTPVVDHWLEREIAQWVHPMKDRSDDPSHHERTLLPRSYISLHAAMDTNNNVKDLICQTTIQITIQKIRCRHYISYSFPISRKEFLICTIPQIEYIPRHLLNQLWSNGLNEKYFSRSAMRDRSDDPSHHELHLAPLI